MIGKLRGQRFLVTGASTGIGLAIAQALLKHGAVVGVHHRRPWAEVAEQLADLGEDLQANIIPLAGELTDSGVPERLIKSFASSAGGLDGLVNNAGGIYNYTDFRKLDYEDWEKTFSLNVSAPFLLIRAAWPYLINSKRGRIVNISTAAVGYGAGPESIHYAASKAALDNLTVSFAKAGAAHDILVNSIRPGVIDTKMRDRITGYDEGKWRKRVDKIPLGHAGRPSDISNIVVYLLSDEGGFVTGQIITVSGGD